MKQQTLSQVKSIIRQYGIWTGIIIGPDNVRKAQTFVNCAQVTILYGYKFIQYEESLPST